MLSLSKSPHVLMLGWCFSGVVLDNDCGRLKVLWSDSRITTEWSLNLTPYYEVTKRESR